MAGEGTSYHVGLSVRGALLRSDDQLRGLLNDDDGHELTPREARHALMEELSKGREVIPCAPCDRWDWKKGCQGHPARTRNQGESDGE